MSANCARGALFGGHPARSSFSCTSGVASAVSSASLMRFDDRLGRALRHDDAEPRRHLRIWKTLLGHGRHIREIFRAAVVDRGDDPDGAGLHRATAPGWPKRSVEVIRPGGEIRQHLRIAAIADRRDVDPGQPLEQLEAEMPGRALAGMAVVQHTRLRLRQRHKFGDVVHRQRLGTTKTFGAVQICPIGMKSRKRIPAQSRCRAPGWRRRTPSPAATCSRPARARDFLGGDRAVGAGFDFIDDRAVPLHRPYSERRCARTRRSRCRPNRE